MKFGLYAPIPMATVGSADVVRAAAQAHQPLPPGTRDIQFEVALDLLLAADDAGFELCLFAERHLGEDLAAWVLASAIGSRFRNMRSLVAVHPGLVDPVMIAKLAASLDRICIPRMAINIVNGWFDEEFRMFGGTVLEGEARYQRTSEFIKILRGLWRNDTFTLRGEHFQLEDGRLLLKPATSAPPEIFSVSRSDRGRDFIASDCDWWFVDYPKEAQTTSEVMRGLEYAIADMNRRTSRTGRKVRYAINPFIALGTSEREALGRTIQEITAAEANPDPRKIERRMMPATKAGLIGTPEEIHRQLKRYEDLGLDLILCKMIPTAENVSLIGREVISPMRLGSLTPT